MTRQRALIFEILQHSPKHLTADEIFAIAREKMPGIARGTVYRNLKLMEQAREIARLEMPDGPDRFDKTSNPSCSSAGLSGSLFDASEHDDKIKNCAP